MGLLNNGLTPTDAEVSVSGMDAQKQLEAAIKAINSGEARLENRIVGAGDESSGSWQTVLVGKDGTVFNDVIAKDLGNGQVKLKTSAPVSYGDNSYIGITTSVNPNTGFLDPLTEQNQLYLGKTPTSGGSLWTNFRDTVESAGVIAGNYFLPGSSLLTSQLVSEGAKEQLSDPTLRLANAVAGTTGGYQGNTANYGKIGESLGGTPTDPNTVGGVTGPDNIDVGGGYNTATNAAGESLFNTAGAASSPASNFLTNTATKLGIKAGVNTLFGKNTGTNMATSSSSNTDFGNLLSGLLGGVGGLMQGSTNTEAMKQYANAITQAGNQAQAQAAFRPVGMTTSFGTSNFQVDPTTGQITQAGYTLSPQLQAAQEGVLGGLRQNLTDAQTQAALGRSYLAQNPQQVASNWLSQQQALLAPSRDTAWARLNQGNYNQGTTGLKVAQGGNLQAANPYASALANAQAQQDAALAAQAQQQGQNAVTFGQGLLSSAYQPVNAGLTTAGAIEQLGQNPYALSTGLGQLSSAAGARTGALGLNAASQAAQAMKQANTYNPYASILSGLGTSSTAGNVLGGLLGNTSLGSSVGNWLGSLGGSNYDWSSIIPDSTFSGLSPTDINSMVGGEDMTQLLGLG